MSEFVTLEEIRAAKERIAGIAVRTPLYRVERARLRMGKFPEPEFDLYIKAESEQPIGSFKLRGAYNMVAQLSPESLRRGVITYSSGNHAQGVAYAARALGAKAVIVMPSNAPEVKKAATRALGAEIVEVGPASSERRSKAEELVAELGYAMIPPYDAPQIIAGQATCGLEIVEQLPGVELVISPVSGGGLLSGTATSVKLAAQAGLVSAAVQVWGAEPELAADAKESFYSKTLVEWPAAKTTRTIGDGLRTQSMGVLNFAHVMKYGDGIVTVSEEEILAAMRVMLTATKLVPEPSGAVTLAAALFHAEELPKVKKVAVILSGGNLEPSLREQLEGELASKA
ncbi:threonine ammonia-lyase [Tunturiibacter gelidoferens]|uniref:Threonine dehydratase n=1 Tax=Tunturiibacter gelidiferens TaxID=3069689 RepID=A0ACC5P4X9_9BACT|nr:threonine/serine dehydratase [Edaphobacter lichenicola]MBB5341910.1 threonine dehydratase [Edaphobacter lichenicola]